MCGVVLQQCGEARWWRCVVAVKKVHENGVEKPRGVVRAVLVACRAAR